MLIRTEEERDRAEVHALNTAAFPTRAEADLVDALRQAARPFISLIAEVDGAVVGHIFFSSVDLPGHPELSLIGLGLMAVALVHQQRGVGSALVRAGLEASRNGGISAMVVLGQAQYHPRFGFTAAARSRPVNTTRRKRRSCCWNCGRAICAAPRAPSNTIPRSTSFEGRSRAEPMAPQLHPRRRRR